MPRRPDPLKELLDLQERMNRLFEETLSRGSDDDLGALAPGWAPLADVFDTEIVTVKVTEGAAYGAALLAGSYPALRAARREPAAAMREE